MLRNKILCGALLITGFVVLVGCAKGNMANQIVESEPDSTSTEAIAPTVTEEVLPEASTTEIPDFPCDIAFESDRDGNFEVYIMNPDGSNQVNLTQNSADDFDPVWSPDGTHIAFASNRENGEEGGQFIYIMLPDGSEVEQISHENESKAPDWSPSGNQIAYSSKGDIYLLDIVTGEEVNLTNSPEWDDQPKFSPDGQQIAWLMDDGNYYQLYVMGLNGDDKVKVTQSGKVNDVEWTVDGRIFTHWEQPDGICFNCLVTADGSEVVDAGGKGTIQEFLPFWTDDGFRVELNAGDVNGIGNDDIFLIGENFPDVFFYLTNSPGNDRNPDAAYQCGPMHGVYPPSGSAAGDDAAQANNTKEGGKPFVIGYTGSIDSIQQKDFDQACAELDVECVKGENITELADKGVDAIVNASNRWDAMGAYPAIHDAAERGIPLFILNAETSENGVYNLSAEHEIYTTTFHWMFQQMNGKGTFVYYNFGDSDYIQNEIDMSLADYPDINAVKMPADYNGNSFEQSDIENMINDDPDIAGIWSSEQLNILFWGINNEANQHPVTECMTRKTELIDWKNVMDSGSDFQCIAQIHPGGTAYEGIYVAYYFLNGLKFKSDAFFEGSGNTLRYDIPVITNVELPDWIGPKLDSLREDEYGLLTLPPMTPDEIKAKWFEE